MAQSVKGSRAARTIEEGASLTMNTFVTLLADGSLVAVGDLASGWLTNWLGAKRDGRKYGKFPALDTLISSSGMASYGANRAEAACSPMVLSLGRLRCPG